MRTKKVVDGVTTEYYWAGSQLAMMVVNPGLSNEKVLKFYYDAEGRPVYFDLNESTYFYVTNLQGDVVALTDSYGEVVSYQYDAWGKPISTDYISSAVYDAMYYNPLRYRGYIYDNETGFYYLQSRYYDPTVGRFINSDGQLNGGFLGNSMFAYCENNPVNRIDAEGEKWYRWLLGGGVLSAVISLIAEVYVTVEIQNGKGHETMEGAVEACAETYSEKTAEENSEYGAIILSKKIDGKTYYYTGKTRKGFENTCWNSFILGYLYHTGDIEGFIHTHPPGSTTEPSDEDKSLKFWPGIERRFIVSASGHIVELTRFGSKPFKKEES